MFIDARSGLKHVIGDRPSNSWCQDGRHDRELEQSFETIRWSTPKYPKAIVVLLGLNVLGRGQQANEPCEPFRFGDREVMGYVRDRHDLTWTHWKRGLVSARG